MAINKLLTPRQRMDLVEFFVQYQPSSKYLRNSRLAYHRQAHKRSNSLSDENFSTDENDYIDEHHKFINSDIISLKYKKKAAFAKSEPVSFVKLVNGNQLRNKQADFQQIGSFSEENISLDDDSSSGYSKTSTKSSASGSNYDLEAYEMYTSIPSVNLLKDEPDSLNDFEDPQDITSLPGDDVQFSLMSVSSEEKDPVECNHDHQMLAQVLSRLLADRGESSPTEYRSIQSIKKAVSLSDLDKLAEAEAYKSTFSALNELEDIPVTVPSMFNEFKAPFESTKSKDDDNFVNLLCEYNGLLEFVSSEFDTKDEETPEAEATFMNTECQQLEDDCELVNEPSMFNFTEDEMQEIHNQLEMKRADEKNEEEVEMQANWRKYLERKSFEKRFRDELMFEDNVDAFAYLNEIEMNFDYFQSELEELYHQNACSSYWHSDPMFIDTMLTYKSNRDAFNLRHYHNEIEYERQLQMAYENGEFVEYDYEFEYDCEYDGNFTNFTYEHEENEEYEYQFEMEQEQESDSSVNSTSGANVDKKAIAAAAAAVQLPMSVKPCVFKLNEGQCLKPDCRFAHDFENITCKYWLDGACFKGDTCEFYHGIVELDAAQLAAVARLKHGSRNRSSASFSSSGKGSTKRKNKSRRSDSVENSNTAKANEPEFKLEMEEFPPLGS